MVASRSFLGLLLICLWGAVGCADDTLPLPGGDGTTIVTPTALDFGEVPIGHRRPLELRISPPPGAQVELFDVRPPFSAAIFSRSGDAVSVRVTYTPERAVTSNTILVVQIEGARDVEVPLSGRGIEALTLAPSRLDFGHVRVGGSATLTVAMTNPTARGMDVEIDRSGRVRSCAEPSPVCFGPLPRPLGDGSRTTLSAGETVSFEARYTPTIRGESLREVVRFRGCPGCPALDVELALEGLAVDSTLACAPSSLDLGRVEAGQCKTGRVRCTNRAGVPVTVRGWRLDGATSAELEADPTRAIGPLASGDVAEVSVRFCPLDSGRETAQLVVESEDGGDRIVDVTARGAVPSLVVSPTSLDFGEVSLRAPARRTLSVHNQSSQIVTIVSVGPASARSPFTAQAASSAILPGATGIITVEVQGTSAGLATDRLHISTDEADAPEIEVPVRARVVDTPDCAYRVSTRTLELGEVARGRWIRRGIEVHNVGAGECLITGASTTPQAAAGGLALVGGAESAGPGTRIAPGDVAVVAVDFAPPGIMSASGQLELSLSSSSDPYVVVALSGTGVDRTAFPAPREDDLGAVPQGCRVTRRVRFHNTSSTLVTLSSVEVDPTGPGTFVVDLGGARLPLNLPSGASIEVGVELDAAALTAHARALAFRGTRDGQPASWFTALDARVVDAGTHQVDHFEQAAVRPTDVLMIIDDSGSMTDSHRLMTDHAAVFLAAATEPLDYQIGVTTMSAEGLVDGRLLPLRGDPSTRRITPLSLPAPDVALADRLRSVGTQGSSNELGLEVVMLALSSPLTFGHNAGLLRPEAALSVMVLSDEQDYSSNVVSFYVDVLRDIKGTRRADDLSFSAIVGDPMGGCASPTESADTGSRYVEVAQQTGGASHSICSTDWAALMSDLGTTMLGRRTRFTLSSRPQPASITVTLDGAVLPSGFGWVFEPESSTVVFPLHASPPPGAQIDIDYDLACP